MVRQMLLLFFVCGTCIFGISCEKSEKNVNQANPEYFVNDTVKLFLSDTAIFQNENVFLIWKEVEDNRCPKGAYCLLPGYAHLTFTGSFKGALDTFKISFSGNALIKNGYSITITDVLPYPEIGKAPGVSENCSLVLGKPSGLLPGAVRDYSGLDACGYIIEMDSGVKLEPAIVNPTFTFKDKQRVMLKYIELKDHASACMAGKIAQITEIYEIIE